MSSSGIPSDGWLWHKYYGKTPAVPFTISLSIINIILFYKEGSMLSKIFLTAIFTLSVLLTGCGKGKRSLPPGSAGVSPAEMAAKMAAFPGKGRGE
ncbi:MAG: hypothetical protein DM484_06170 [Candidatus Methylumidiphilus alinenensis]|uniref:Uncharacterized protein n=1 Tax=Candidatus Methylumidiphilus alinenensis TaxID=2202197 RepID=A0A2W4RIY8_9GAMM|nr:MAG: hypothetical protein DM484_06170 [Candidatus Methylumidiphilus alinenensis]